MPRKYMTVGDLLNALKDVDPKLKVLDENTGQPLMGMVIAKPDFPKPREKPYLWLVHEPCY